MLKGFWRKDWVTGLAIAVVMLLLGENHLIQGLERAAYDIGVRNSHRTPGNRIAIIAIDDQSIQNIGRWPWSRTILAEMDTKLAAAKAKVIGNTILLLEAQRAPGSEMIDSYLRFIQDSSLASLQAPELIQLQQQMQQDRQALDSDGMLSAAMKESANVLLGMEFALGEPLGRPDEGLPDYVKRFAIPQENIHGRLEDGKPFPAISVTPPIRALGEPATGLGHLSFILDQDGGIRRELLVTDYYGEIFPSLGLAIAARSLNLGSADIRVELGTSVSLGNLTIRTDPHSFMQPFFYQGEEGGNDAFPIYSFYDVREGKISMDNFRDRIVLIGTSAYGVGSPMVTPVAQQMHPVVVLANIIAGILNQHFFVVPEWAGPVESLAFLVIALYLILVLPKLTAGLAALLSALLFLLLLGSHQYLMITQALWLQLMLPCTLLVCGYLALITKRFLVTERGKILADEASAQSNRTLGLTLQQQGQLDMAFDKFRQCPLDDSMMEPLYNLALDFERKRQFNKAQSVLEYMARHDAGFRDINEKIKRNKALQDTVVFGVSGGGKPGTLILEGENIEKPMLGRYQVEKELGKGAMGVVYLGRDPKINRTVAIKTLALSQEFDEDEIGEVKERFFREAETAGRLAHPNIVTIYDAGEEHDLAYIAMEYLNGHDLSRYTKKDHLLPLRNTLQIIILSADALHYAHQQSIVHRDIKPANVMLLTESSTIKLTDFGIARITDSSKTKTGMVLGTPSYMSPEQLRGAKNVDGRSDLFSLGVMFYQMLCGELPFKGDSMATLMYKIANEEPARITDVRGELTTQLPCVLPILDRMLAKTPEQRYQTGHELARDLRNCLKTIKKK